MELRRWTGMFLKHYSMVHWAEGYPSTLERGTCGTSMGGPLFTAKLIERYSRRWGRSTRLRSQIENSCSVRWTLRGRIPLMKSCWPDPKFCCGRISRTLLIRLLHCIRMTQSMRRCCDGRSLSISCQDSTPWQFTTRWFGRRRSDERVAFSSSS